MSDFEHEEVKRAGDMNEEVRLRIGEWQKRLLQMNRRNNLLYFKPGRGTVTITGMTPDELDSKLQRSRSGLEFPFVLPTARQSAFSFEDESDVEIEPQVIPGDLSTDCEPKDLQRRLRNLRRKDREWEEEQGLNVLFLAMGFLHWIDSDGASVRSPLVLVPCDLALIVHELGGRGCSGPRKSPSDLRRCVCSRNALSSSGGHLRGEG